MKTYHNIAFKLNYNDGPNSPFGVGFFGRCTEQVIKNNIESGKVYCKHSECYDYYNNGFHGDASEEFPCWESTLFKVWGFGSGIYQRGKRKGQGIRIRNIQPNYIAILTTRLPFDEEKNRKIIGYFFIEEIISDNFDWIQSSKKQTIIIPKENWLNFWNYYHNEKGIIAWGTLLFRYVSDETIALVIQSILPLIKNEKKRLIIEKHLEIFKKRTGGILPRLNKFQQKHVHKMILKNKYGAGGESIAHKKLKKYVYDNPDVIGISDIKNKYIEFVFATLDTVDVVFELTSGKWVVIEIELAGKRNCLIGMMQAVKYRSLMEVHQNFKLGKNVSAYLIAHNIPNYIKNKCKKYSIKAIEISKNRPI